MCARQLDDLLRSPEWQAVLLTGAWPLAGLAIPGLPSGRPSAGAWPRLGPSSPFARGLEARCGPSAI